MSKHLRRIAAAVFAACWTVCAPEAALAACNIPAGTIASPQRAAEFILSNAERVGIAVVTRRENLAKKQAETIDIVFPLKGKAGSIVMNLPIEGGHVIVTNGESSFGVPEGTLVLAALHQTPSGAVVSECTLQILHGLPRERLLRALFEVSRRPRGR